MRCSVGLSTAKNSDQALNEVLEQLGPRSLDDQDDIALIFSSIHHADSLGELATTVMQKGLARNVIGCTGESIIGQSREVEGSEALSIWTAKIPGVSVKAVDIAPGNIDLAGHDELDSRTLLLLADPFTVPLDGWFKKLAQKKSKLRVVGGMASGSQTPGNNRLILNGEVKNAGAVGLFLDGPLTARTIVSQGCRPIGRPYIVTKAEGNVIRELGRRPALEVLRELFEELSDEDRDRVQSGLHIGTVISEYQETFSRGDFLVRNVLGVDPTGGIAMTDLARVGQTIQFHVRDAETADEDLREMLGSYALGLGPAKPVGALLFSCNGRGTRLFDRPNHDVNAIHEALGPIPVAGFFAMGELGPVGDQNFIHGFTASALIFDSPEE